MRLDKLDLNLLIALDALLQERGVSLAADRLNMSQSAASGALGRLREYFRDDLLVLQGRSMALTPRAEKLIDPVRSIIEQIRATILVAEPFDPATSDRTLSVMATDYIFEILLRPVIVACATEAPGIRFELVPIVEHPVEALQRGRADILIGIDNVVSTEHPSALLYTEDFVIAGWRDNPLLADPMTRETYEELGHVAVRFGQQTSSYEATATRLRSVARRVEVIAPNFLSVGGLLVGTERIATIHRLLAVRMAEYLPLTLRELPFEMPPVRESAQWSSRNANDPAIAWLVERLKQIAAQLRSSSGAPEPSLPG
ncbi:DNA-binding transcriptional LysR family regulator [Sphingomonas vulcanisoli]|uniref:DNA-binding transcriptional LysR family regulator n=1 Tax=Sphingomonas vulcanisoli TaxID=1658060 RepID=A0ABX0TP55_9SPHN|nr:LysR family transcriptional regulator [Sphingomonas vulcanisoli]NIJ07314.1 DNA-binding transcriptional LysR family regulator [Sphingomonas vulcanisoli]